MRSIIYIILTFISATCSVFSQSIDTQKLDTYFEMLSKHNKFMGSVAISKNNQILYEKAVGFRNLKDSIPALTTTVYSIGSVSKTFTAVLIFKAIEQNKIHLTTTVDVFFPSLPQAKNITIQNLLNHSSGIANFTDTIDYLTWCTQKKSEKEMLEIITSGGSDFKPGTKNAYSNSNYVLLSYILEHIFGKKYAEILDINIVQPLQLKNTYFGTSAIRKKQEALSYTYTDQWNPEPDTHATVPIGAGAIKSTATDLVIFTNALFNEKLIHKESLKQMMTMTNGYGSGLFDYSFQNHNGIGHDGAIDGYKSIITYFEKEGLTYAVASNAMNYKLDMISATISKALFDIAYEIPSFVTVVLTPEQLDVFTGTYSAEGLPFKITIARSEQSLTAQATGQAVLPLETKSKNIFTFDKAGIELIFMSEENSMLLKQGGNQFQLQKE